MSSRDIGRGRVSVRVCPACGAKKGAAHAADCVLDRPRVKCSYCSKKATVVITGRRGAVADFQGRSAACATHVSRLHNHIRRAKSRKALNDAIEAFDAPATPRKKKRGPVIRHHSHNGVRTGGLAKPRKKPKAKKAAPKRSRALPVRERQFKHIVESLTSRGKSLKVAERIAAATVNKQRAKLARSGRGLKLVGRGGSRNQWYPGKADKSGNSLRCLMHKRRFKTKSGYLSHLRSHKRLAMEMKRMSITEARRLSRMLDRHGKRF